MMPMKLINYFNNNNNNNNNKKQKKNHYYLNRNIPKNTRNKSSKKFNSCLHTPCFNPVYLLLFYLLFYLYQFIGGTVIFSGASLSSHSLMTNPFHATLNLTVNKTVRCFRYITSYVILFVITKKLYTIIVFQCYVVAWKIDK